MFTAKCFPEGWLKVEVSLCYKIVRGMGSTDEYTERSTREQEYERMRKKISEADIDIKDVEEES